MSQLPAMRPMSRLKPSKVSATAAEKTAAAHVLVVGDVAAVVEVGKVAARRKEHAVPNHRPAFRRACGRRKATTISTMTSITTTKTCRSLIAIAGSSTTQTTMSSTRKRIPKTTMNSATISTKSTRAFQLGMKRSGT